MSALKPYADWMRTFHKDATKPLTIVGTKERTVDFPAFFRFHNQMGYRLTRAKRFICPIDIDVQEKGAEAIHFDASPFVAENPHLPFPYLYLQCELESKDDDKEPLWILFALAELDKHRFEGMYASWEPKTRQIRQRPYRLLYSPEGIEAVRFGYDPDQDEASDRSLEFILFLPLLMVNEINNARPESFQHHPGRKILLPTTKLKNSTRIEHTRLINIGKGGGGGGEATGEGTKHREHDVRGHWRHLKHGRVIWVRNHKRGDPALGTVDSEYLTGEQHA